MYVLFIRHGESGADHGCPEEGTLTRLGIRQAELAGEALVGQGIERLFSSPYPRAMQTALNISRKTGLKVELRHFIHEKSGPGKRATRGEIAAKFPQFDIPNEMPEVWWPDCQESWESVYERVRPAVRELQSLEGKHERIAVVAHGGSIDALVSVWVDCPPTLERSRFYHHNCCFTLVSYKEGRGRVHYVNQVDHLASLGKRELFFD
jgi:broad specificity phosphatase PhoE